MQVNLSGDDVEGGSIVIPTDHALYAVLADMIAADAAAKAA
jgi:hypothetical protein